MDSKRAGSVQVGSAPAVTTCSLLARYSDASSSYWPPCWDFARLRTATVNDLESLPADELEKMQAGLRDVLGEDGVGQLARLMYEEEQRRQTEVIEQINKPEPSAVTPNWLRQWSRAHEGRSWGFVAFRTACYDKKDNDRWEGFKERLHQTLDIPFERVARERPLPAGFKVARDRFEIRWVEDPGLANADAETLRERYTAMIPDLPAGVVQKLFLCSSPDAVASFVDMPGQDMPTTESKWWRPEAPFLLAMTADSDPGLEEDHEEYSWLKPVFKVAVETLVDELWWIVDSDMTSLRRLTRLVKAADELGRTEGVLDEEAEDLWWSYSPSPARLRRRRRGQVET